MLPAIEKNSICIGDRFTKATPVFLSPPLLSSHQGTAKKALSSFEALGRLLKWVIKLSVFDITFHPRSVLKSQVLANFIAKSSIPTMS
jgi:hypothetical protein